MKEVGKLSLPTLSEIEAKIKNCNISSLDLKNQFYSIELEPESRSKTNFYYANQIWQHDRLPMGLASSPYIATMAMKYTFSDDDLEKFKEENNYADLPFSRFDQFLSF